MRGWGAKDRPVPPLLHLPSVRTAQRVLNDAGSQRSRTLSGPLLRRGLPLPPGTATAVNKELEAAVAVEDVEAVVEVVGRREEAEEEERGRGVKRGVLA